MTMARRTLTPNQSSLIYPRHSVTIVEITSSDARTRSDKLKLLGDLILRSEPMYPGIDRWFKSKVVPGLASGERTALIAEVDGSPVASAVVKRGHRSKFCHLRIDESEQDRHLGELLFSLMAMHVRPSCVIS